MTRPDNAGKMAKKHAFVGINTHKDYVVLHAGSFDRKKEPVPTFRKGVEWGMKGCKNVFFNREKLVSSLYTHVIGKYQFNKISFFETYNLLEDMDSVLRKNKEINAKNCAWKLKI